MQRLEIINKIGEKYHIGNLENGEFSYPKALKTIGKNIMDYQKGEAGVKHDYADIRFENDRMVIIVETKNNFAKWDKIKIQRQLQAYVTYEKALTDKTIVAILAETDGDEVWTWFGQSVIIDDDHRKENVHQILPFSEYEELCFGKVNNKIKVVDSIKQLNEMLHADGINEKLRSQFVGTCLLALKNNLVYKDVKPSLDESGKELKPNQIVIQGIQRILSGLLAKSQTLNKAGKLAILNNKVLEDQDVESLTYNELREVLQYIDDNVVPYINDKNTAGQDLLNLFLLHLINTLVNPIKIRLLHQIIFVTL